MFGIAGRSREKLVAIVDIGSAGVGVAIIARGEKLRLVTSVRMDLAFGERSRDALVSGVLQQFSLAGQKVLTDLATSEWKGTPIGTVYCIVGAPWSRSFSAHATSSFKEETLITEAMISALAQQALKDQKEVDQPNLLEASVMRVMLNGYTTSAPAGKHAHMLEVVALVSDCDASIKTGAQDTIQKLFPGASIAWRSGARAALFTVREIAHTDTALIVQVSEEATDLIALRKGIIEAQTNLPEGIRSIMTAFAADKPPEETLALLTMMEHDQSASEASGALMTSIAKAEPELAHKFGEALAKLVAVRRLPNDLLLIAPAHLAPWLSRFFSRIDFTQFTATMQPFVVTEFSVREILEFPEHDTQILNDPGLSIGCALVNIESKN